MPIERCTAPGLSVLQVFPIRGVTYAQQIGAGRSIVTYLS